MITREQVAELREGDFVELSGHPSQFGSTTRGPLYERQGELYVGDRLVRYQDGSVNHTFADRICLTVISRAPRPLHDCPDCTHMPETVKVGALWKAPAASGPYCAQSSPDKSRFLCCLPANHAAPHIAGNGKHAVAVWS